MKPLLTTKERCQEYGSEAKEMSKVRDYATAEKFYFESSPAESTPFFSCIPAECAALSIMLSGITLPSPGR
jgi:hypothetical protein